MNHVRQNELRSVLLLSNAAGSVGFSFLPILFANRGLSNPEIAIIAIPYSFFLILSNSIFGRLSDSKGRVPFLRLGMFTSAIGMFLYLFPQSFTSFILVRIIHGITLGIFPSAITGIASDRKIQLGGLSSFGSLGWALGSYFGGIIAMLSSLDVAFAMSSVVFLIGFVIALRMHNPDFSPERSFTASSSYKYAIKKNYPEYLMVLMRHGSANAIWVFWALFLQDELGLTLAQIGVVQLTNMGTQFIIMKGVTDRFNPKKMLIFGAVMSSVAFYTFTISTNYYQIVGANVILGISWAFFYVGGLRSVEENSKDQGIVATSTGLYNASISASQIIGPILALFLFNISQEYTLAMFTSAVVTLIAISFYVLYFRRDIFSSS